MLEALREANHRVQAQVLCPQVLPGGVGWFSTRCFGGGTFVVFVRRGSGDQSEGGGDEICRRGDPGGCQGAVGGAAGVAEGPRHPRRQRGRAHREGERGRGLSLTSVFFQPKITERATPHTSKTHQ